MKKGSREFCSVLKNIFLKEAVLRSLLDIKAFILCRPTQRTVLQSASENTAEDSGGFSPFFMSWLWRLWRALVALFHTWLVIERKPNDLAMIILHCQLQPWRCCRKSWTIDFNPHEPCPRFSALRSQHRKIGPYPTFTRTAKSLRAFSHLQ